jgi:hypothetical protein
MARSLKNVLSMGVATATLVLSFGVASAHVPTPVGKEGCTPGFWKNSVIAWESTAPNVYSPGATLGSVFTGVSPELADATLLEALQFQGTDGAEARLLRAAVAALLNTVHFDVDYPLGSEGQVISAVNDALAAGGDALKTLKNKFDRWNNLGCPLSANVDY